MYTILSNEASVELKQNFFVIVVTVFLQPLYLYTWSSYTFSASIQPTFNLSDIKKKIKGSFYVCEVQRGVSSRKIFLHVAPLLLRNLYAHACASDIYFSLCS